MKQKTIIIVIAIVLAVGIIAGGVYLYFTSLPEYTLRKMVNEVNRDGIEAIEPYLAPSLKELFRTIVNTVNNPLVKITGSITGIDKNEQISLLLDQFTSLEWKLQEVQRGKDSANVVIGMKGTSISGNINLEMARIDGKWLIEDISIPLMSWTNGA